MKLYVLDADYIDGGGQSIIRLFCKDKDGKTVVCLDSNFYPYFYVLPSKGKERELKKRIGSMQSVKIRNVVAEEKIVSGESRRLLKVSCFLSHDVSAAREVVKGWKNLVEGEYEYSINFYKRYIIDRQIAGWMQVTGREVKGNYLADKVIEIRTITPTSDKSEPPLKFMSFDTEVLDEQGKRKIIMISVKSDGFERVLTYKPDKHHGKYVEVLKGEEEMLNRFVELVEKQDPDILLGYNSDLFDFQVLRERADAYPNFKLILSRDSTRMVFERRARISSARLAGRVHIDLFGFIGSIMATQLQTEVLSLDAVSQELLGDSKIGMEYEDILEAWTKGKDLGKLADYCLKDSELTLRLGKFMLPQIIEMSELCGQLLFDTSRMTYSQLVEWYLSKKSFSMGNIIPNQPKWDEIQERRGYAQYEGGFVKEPIGGLHEKLAVMDFRSLYPSVIATFNISPETLNCKDCKKGGYEVPGKDYWFCKKRKGFVSTVIKELIERRARIKSGMANASGKESLRLNSEQQAVKTVTNATYGYFGFASSKWYCRECAESAAAFGRFYIKKVIDEAEREGFTVVYGDTDSLFVKASGNLAGKVKIFLSRVNRKLPGIIKLDLQGMYERGIFIPRGVGPGTAKKRYALIDSNGSLTVRGLEKVRSDWSIVAKDTQERVLEMVLGKKDVDGAVKYVRQVIEKLKSGEVPLKELIIIEQLSKPLSEYKAIGPHVVAARKMKERGRPLGEGMPILYVITKGKGSISQRAEPFEDAELKDADVDYYVKHQIVPAALRILAAMGVTEEELLGESLKDFLR